MRAPDNQLPSGITLDRDLFDYDARRAIRVGLLVLALTAIVGITNAQNPLSGWQFEAILAIVASYTISAILEWVSKSNLAYIPVSLVLLAVPIYYAQFSKVPWIAYGFVIITLVIYAASLRNNNVAALIMYALIVLQYIVAHKNYSSISDNTDNSLLNSYFSTLWCAVVGVGALILKSSYLAYSNRIEGVISKIHEFQVGERLKISQLNLRDFENSQLHGTVLNTLIAIRNSPKLLANKLLISEYVLRDLEVIEKHNSMRLDNLAEFLIEPSNFPFQRDLFVTLDLQEKLEIDNSIEELAVEIIRELILNTKKHSRATEAHIVVRFEEQPYGFEESDDLVSRRLIIEVYDNSPSFDPNQNGELPEQAARSDSIQRLLSGANGSVDVVEVDGKLLRKVEIPVPQSNEGFLRRIVELREQSISYLGLGYIRISLIYAVLTLPAYLYLKITPELAGLLALYIALTGNALVGSRWARYSAIAGSILAIATFPLIIHQGLACSELQWLPWLFNGLIGSVFFATLIIRNSVLQWVPVALFYYVNVILTQNLPAGCKRILDGSTPAIITIVLITIALGFARKRDLTFEARFIADAKSEFEDIETTRRNVLEMRSDLIKQVHAFAEGLQDSEETDISQELHRVINQIKAFLLTSQHFKSPFALAMYQLTMRRFEQGNETSLNINTFFQETTFTPRDYEKFIENLEEIIRGRDVTITITGSTSVSIEISANDGSWLPSYNFQRGRVTAKTV